MKAVEWGNPNWGKPGHNVHVEDSANFLDAEGLTDDE